MDNKTIPLIGVAIVFMFLFFTTFFYLGVLNPSGLAPAGGGETTSMARGISKSGEYHIYNPLAAAGSFVAFVIGLIVLLWSLADLRERIKANVPLILAILGIIFLFMSIYSIVAGLHDLLTFTKYETTIKPTFGQQYGWFIQFIVYGIIGVALIYAAERLRKEAGEARSVIPSATSPLGAFLLLATFLLFVSGFHSFMYLTDYTEYRQSLAWVIETFIFGLMGYYMLKMSEKIRRSEGATKSIFSFPAASLGVILLLMTFGAYLFGSFDYIYRDYGVKNLNWFIESAVYCILGVAFSLIGDSISWKDGEESNGFSTSMFIFGVLLLIPAVIQFLVGFNDFLYSSNPNLKWFYELLLLLIPGVIAVLAGDYVRRTRRIPKLVPPQVEKPVRKRVKQEEE